MLTDDAGGRIGISGNRLVVGSGIDFETDPSFEVRVRISDPSGATDTATFTSV